MPPFDELDLRDAEAIDRVSPEQLQHVRGTIADDLLRHHDAWPAIRWLAATRDDSAKRSVLHDLEQVMQGVSIALLTHEAAADTVASDAVFGRAAKDRRQIGRAFEFCSALQAALPDRQSVPADAEFERTVRLRQERAEANEQRVASLTRLGVQPGNGLPFWEMYMRRRNKKNWGN